MPDSRRERWILITASLVMLASVAFGFVLWFTRTVMIPFVLAVFVVAVVAPIADWLEVKARFRKWMSVSIVMALVLVGAAIVLMLLTYTAAEVGSSIDSYRNNILMMTKQFSVTSGDVIPPEAGEIQEVTGMAELDTHSGFLNKMYRLFDFGWVRPILSTSFDTVKDVLEEDWKVYVPRTVGWLFGQARIILSTFFLMTIFVFFLLVAREPSRLDLSGYAMIEQKCRRYLSIKTSVSALTGVMVGLILSALGVPMAIVFGVLTFMLNFIPSIGSIIATFLPLPIAFAEFVLEPLDAGEPAQWWMLAAAIVIPGSVQIFVGNVIEPRVMGEGLELHPIVILIALVFWGLLWGPIGAILAVPITAVIRIASSRFKSLQVVSDLMAGHLPSG